MRPEKDHLGPGSERSRAGAILETVFAWWAPALIAIVSVSITLIASASMRSIAQADRAMKASEIKDSIQEDIERVLDNYTNALYHTRGYVLSSSHVELREWKAFVRESHLERIHPGVWGFGYVQRVEGPDELETLVGEMRGYGISDFSVRPLPTSPVSHENPAYVIKYEEPESRNRQVWGFNTAANPVNRDAYDRATATGVNQLSKPFRLAQQRGAQSSGVVLVAPHYDPYLPIETEKERQGAILGWLVVVIDFTHFFKHEGLDLPETASVKLSLPGEDGEPVVLYQRKAPDPDPEPDAWEPGTDRESHFRTTVQLAGNDLTLDLALDPSGLETSHENDAAMMLGIGLVASVLLTLIAVLIARSRSYAHTLATKMTEQLRDSEHEQRELAEQALESSRVKSMFLANMSHEIRTPMTAILGYTEVLSELTHEIEGTEPMRQPLTGIRAAGTHLLAIINDILDLTKIDSGKLEISRAPGSAAELIAEVVMTFRNKAVEQGVELSAHLMTPVHHSVLFDIYRVRQVLINLVGNAIKFTEQGSVRIELSEVGNELVFQVIDTGVGISPKKLRAIFDPFTQADDSLSRKHQGTGLGLSISCRLAHCMGGTIKATSKPGTGSTFTFRMPLEIEQGTEDDTVTEIPEIGQNAPTDHELADTCVLSGKVLIAEDGPDNQRLLRHFLTRAGHTVEIVENGEEAVYAWRNNPNYDLIIMDMQMPVLDGYGATRRLRDLGCELPILALTAHAMSHDRAKCLDAGCTEYDSKPINRKRLLRKVQILIVEATKNRAA